MLANPWGLLALLSIPIIIGIHLFRHRFQPHRVAGLFLWSTPGRDPTSGRRIHKLDSTVSLLLELALALFLSLYLCDPRLGATAGVGHQVIVLDTSASMAAHEGLTDTAEAAREAVRAVIAEAGRQGQVSLVATGHSPWLLAGPAAPAEEARQALLKWRPAARSHDLGPALDLARELAGQEAVVHIVSDRLPDPSLAAGRWHWHAAGRALPNAALLAARRERTARPGEDSVFLRLAAYAAGPVEVSLRVTSGEALLGERRMTLAPGTEKRLTLTIPGNDVPVAVDLSPDALAIDNHALLCRPPVRPVVCRNDLPEGEERAAVARVLHADPDVAPAGPGQTPHVVFAAPGVVPTGLPETWWCRVGPAAPAAAGAPPESKDFLGPFLMEKGHPLLAGVHLGGVIWGGAAPGEPGLFPLVSAGDRPLVALRPQPAGMDLLVNVQMKRSSLHKTSDWPILIGNLLQLRREALPGALSSNVWAGDALAVNLPRETKEPVQLVLPGGERRDIPGRGRVVLSMLETPGLYKLVEGKQDLHTFAVNFRDPAESDLTGAGRGDRAPTEAGGSPDVRRAEALVDPRFHFPLLLAGLAFFLANAFWLRHTLGVERRPSDTNAAPGRSTA